MVFVISLHKCLRSISETQTAETDRGEILMLKWPLPFSIYRLKALLCFPRLQLAIIIPPHLSVSALGNRVFVEVEDREEKKMTRRGRERRRQNTRRRKSPDQTDTRAKRVNLNENNLYYSGCQSSAYVSCDNYDVVWQSPSVHPGQKTGEANVQF